VDVPEKEISPVAAGEAMVVVATESQVGLVVVCLVALCIAMRLPAHSHERRWVEDPVGRRETHGG